MAKLPKPCFEQSFEGPNPMSFQIKLEGDDPPVCYHH